jgi:chemotaxis protein MotB
VSAARRHKKHHHEEHENHERWLVSGYDMMTLLFAVFVVLYAISSTNVSKVHALTQSLQEAFSGPVLSGGRAMMQTGSTSQDGEPTATPPLPALSPVQALQEQFDAAQSSDERARKAGLEEEAFQDLKRRIDALVDKAGLGSQVSTSVSLRGLKVRLLTDKLFFDSGSAVVNAAALPTLEKIGGIIAAEAKHPVQVEGHTDDRPIVTAQYPSNWQLSGARAGAVVQRLAAAGVSPARMSLGGYAAEHAVASNASAEGRAKNRRVEIVLTRLHGANPSHGGDS